MPEVIALKDWYPAMADKWVDRLASLERQGVKVVYEPNERRGWVIHHTVGGAATDPRTYARQVANSHWGKWLRPGGYNFLVGTDARIREMSGLLHVGAHSGTHEWNRTSIGLAFQGDFRGRPPSDSMLDAAREFMASVPVSDDQWTHRAVRPEPTSCPGNALARLLPLEVTMFNDQDRKNLNAILGILRKPLGGPDGPTSRVAWYESYQLSKRLDRKFKTAVLAGSAGAGAIVSEIGQRLIGG